MLPSTLYIHTPWCIKKCPYCDFNSHKSPEILPEKAYVQALIADLQIDLQRFPPRKILSIFIGGGTPSLLSAQAYRDLFEQLQHHLPFAENIEITMEANPGTIEQQRFKEYREVGINRLSLGIQSFNSNHLKKLGRIHDANQAHKAIEIARKVGFTNLNLDIMHGLPDQTIAEGLTDLMTALAHQPDHLSWYQLTIEPNTLFYKQRPPLPDDENIALVEEEGFALLEKKGYARYEISAFSQPGKASQHNLNYWLFGDYFGIGAGAHGKLTLPNQKSIYRTAKQRQPAHYLSAKKPFIAQDVQIQAEDLIFEFMLNTSRLSQPIPYTLFTERTFLPLATLMPKLLQAEKKGLIKLTELTWQVTPLGRRFTNELQALFLHD